MYVYSIIYRYYGWDSLDSFSLTLYHNIVPNDIPSNDIAVFHLFTLFLMRYIEKVRINNFRIYI